MDFPGSGLGKWCVARQYRTFNFSYHIIVADEWLYKWNGCGLEKCSYSRLHACLCRWIKIKGARRTRIVETREFGGGAKIVERLYYCGTLVPARWTESVCTEMISSPLFMIVLVPQKNQRVHYTRS